MWIFDGVIHSQCQTCGQQHDVPVSHFEIDAYGGEYHENGMGAETNYDISYEFECTNCGKEIKLSFDATEYPLDCLSYVIDNSRGATCSSEPYITYLDEETIYTFPEPEIYIPERRIITDISLIENSTPQLIKFLNENPQYLNQIDPRQFEEIIAEIFRNKGFEVELTARTRDGGKDIIAIHRHELGIETKYFIECKRYAMNNKVGVELVRALHGVKNSIHGPNKVILATTSTFTKGAIDFANNQAASRWDIELKDYSEILRWLGQYKHRS